MEINGHNPVSVTLPYYHDIQTPYIAALHTLRYNELDPAEWGSFSEAGVIGCWPTTTAVLQGAVPLRLRVQGAPVMDKGELTPEEIAALRKMLEQDERVAWFWASVRRWAAGAAAVLAALVAFREDVQAMVTWIFKGPS